MDKAPKQHKILKTSVTKVKINKWTLRKILTSNEIFKLKLINLYDKK